MWAGVWARILGGRAHEKLCGRACGRVLCGRLGGRDFAWAAWWAIVRWATNLGGRFGGRACGRRICVGGLVGDELRWAAWWAKSCVGGEICVGGRVGERLGGRQNLCGQARGRGFVWAAVWWAAWWATDFSGRLSGRWILVGGLAMDFGGREI